MAGAKLQNVDEFRRWWDDGRSYDWIIGEYERKYNLRITPSAIGNWRARLGLPRRQETNLDLIPWSVKPEHRYRHALAMLRAEGRRRAGLELSDLQARRLDNFRNLLAEEDAVIHYDPDTEQGFFYVRRRPGIDEDIIRVPEKLDRERGRRD